jgi:hypothetical protein
MPQTAQTTNNGNTTPKNDEFLNILKMRLVNVVEKQQQTSAEIKVSNDSNDIVKLNKRIVSVRENEELMATINQVF